MRRRSFSAAVPMLLFVGCAEAESAANLDADYVLSTLAPECANIDQILLRYEDDWLPGTCVGITQRWDEQRIRIEWRCRLETNVGSTVDAPFEGVLTDPDGDGSFSGTLVVRTLPDLNSTTLSEPAAYTWTLTPLP